MNALKWLRKMCSGLNDNEAIIKPSLFTNNELKKKTLIKIHLYES